MDYHDKNYHDMNYGDHSISQLAGELRAISEELCFRSARCHLGSGTDEYNTRLEEHRDALSELAETLREGEEPHSKVRAHRAQNALQTLIAGLLGGGAVDSDIEDFALHLLEGVLFITGVKDVSDERARSALQRLYKCERKDAQFILNELEERALAITGATEDDLERYDDVFETAVYDGDNIPRERMTYSPSALL